MIDVGAACAALDVTPGELADVFRHEAGRLLTEASSSMNDETIGNPSTLVDAAMRWYSLSLDCETEWLLRTGDLDASSNEAGSNATEATPHAQTRPSSLGGE